MRAVLHESKNKKLGISKSFLEQILLPIIYLNILSDILRYESEFKLYLNNQLSQILIIN